MLGMTFLNWVAGVVLFLQLPIPLYWFVVHPQVNFWRQHEKAAYVTGLLLSWPPVTASLIYFRDRLFRKDDPPLWSVVAGLLLIILEGWIFWRVHRDLGTHRLVGKTELSGRGEIAHRGIYAYMRHPRYVGSFLAILGACLMVATRAMWVTAGVWTLLMLTAIHLEERELRTRFGNTYEEYCRQVSRFIPLRRSHY
jgi:protein-S-isoprenylcysteine O-methyltransferase Ste14